MDEMGGENSDNDIGNREKRGRRRRRRALSWSQVNLDELRSFRKIIGGPNDTTTSFQPRTVERGGGGRGRRVEQRRLIGRI